MNQYRPWTKGEVAKLRQYYASMSMDDLEFLLKRPKSGIVGKASSLGISKGYFVKWTPTMEQYLRSNYATRTKKQLAEDLGVTESKVANKLNKLGIRLPPEIVEQRRRLSIGKPPPNKGKKLLPEVYAKAKATMFKKGQRVHNEAKDGDIRIRHDHEKTRNGRPYKWIRLSKGKWEILHVNIWKAANGPVPKGHVIIFIDGNTMNCDLTNLQMITMADNMLRNSAALNLPDNYVARTIIGKSGNKEDAQLIIEKMPDLIEAKRNLLLLNREIKNNAS